jgi:hypothetical protein
MIAATIHPIPDLSRDAVYLGVSFAEGKDLKSNRLWGASH